MRYSDLITFLTTQHDAPLRFRFGSRLNWLLHVGHMDDPFHRKYEVPL